MTPATRQSIPNGARCAGINPTIAAFGEQIAARGICQPDEQHDTLAAGRLSKTVKEDTY